MAPLVLAGIYGLGGVWYVRGEAGAIAIRTQDSLSEAKAETGSTQGG